MSRPKFSSLQTRVLSALIIAPVFLAVVWYGGWPFIGLLAIIFGVAASEWYQLCSRLPIGKWAALFCGAIYILVSFYSFYLCRVLGLEHILLLLFMVWASDIGAYFFGKFIGGPKLMPLVSPNKTWAGLGGAVLCPAFVLLLFMFVSGDVGGFNPFLFALLLVLGGIVGITGQAGDLLVSFVKRQAKVKDTGTLIPGHGGVLDRIDALLLVTPIFYVLLKYFILITTVT